MKRPSFQFYPGDWLHDAALRMVSVGARGLWIDMICLMHQGSDYGYLKVNGKVILPPNLARMCGATLLEVEGWISELKNAGVFSMDDENCIFSRRMIRDEEIRKARADGGFKGGNPNLMKDRKVNGKDNLQDNLQPTPSSSSSSSSSVSIVATSKRKQKTSLPDEIIPTDEHRDFAGIHGLSLSVEMEKFRLHHEERLTKSGNWNSSFSKWLHNAVAFKAKNAPDKSYADKQQQAADLLTGRNKNDATNLLD